MSITTNVVANYFGQGWRALMGLAFVPLYIRYLGIEAYGLISIFALLQAWLVLLDIGLRPALGREMARFTGGAHNAQSIRDLLRSIELIGITIAGVIVFGFWAASGWLASHWVTATHLPVQMIAQALAVMGIVTALRFIENIYISSMVGLQRQLLQNIVTSTAATIRGLGAVALLAWVSPSIRAFFLWQALMSIITVALFAGIVHRALPPAPLPARFSKSALRSVWRFAAGVTALSFLTLLLTQIDKILLSRLLTLESFGYYALAAGIANGLLILTGPITTALNPRFTELATTGDDRGLRKLYHQGAQFVTVLMGSAAVVIIVFGDRVLRLWTGNPVLTQQAGPLLSVLAVGALFNGLMWVPYQLQLAVGWTSLMLKLNTAAVGLFVPAILVVVPTYGAIGAARIWVALNACYLIVAVPLMHRRLLRYEKWRWYREDVGLPLVAATVSALLCRWLMPREVGKLSEAGILLMAASCVLIGAALAAPVVRNQIAQHLQGSHRFAQVEGQ